MAKTLATLFVRIIRDERVYKKVCEEVRSVDMSSLQAMDKSLKYTEMVGISRSLQCNKLVKFLKRQAW